LLQAIAPMLIRIGIDTKVVALPWAVFIAQASDLPRFFGPLLT
jgi:hypothetical protein